MPRWKLNSSFLKTGLQFIAVFLVTALIFYLYQRKYFNFFLDIDDSYFHVAFTKYMVAHGLVVHQFPYVQFSFLRDSFVDWHFGYHLLMIPFIKFFGEPGGAKILHILICGSIFGTIFLILKTRNLKFAWLYAIILFFLMPGEFYLRMSHFRGAIFALFLMVLCLYWIVKKRPIALAITMFILVWSYYAAAPLIFVPLLTLVAVQILRKEKADFQLLTWGTVGFLVGLIVNPYFPTNTHFLISAISMNLNDTHNQLYSPLENFPVDTWYWFYGSMMAVVLLVAGIVISLVKNIKQDALNLAFLMLALVILVLQWKSLRFIEWWPLFGALTGLLFIGNYIENVLFHIRVRWRTFESGLILVLLFIFAQESIFHGLWEYRKVQSTYAKFENNQMDIVKSASDYIKNNSNEGDIVFTYWDRFAQLFYLNQKNHYIVGMNPMYLSQYDSKLFDEYIDILYTDASKTDVSVIKDHFNAKWVIFNSSQTKLKEKMEARSDIFQKKIDDTSFIIFKVK